MGSDFDIVIVGGGPAGLATALWAVHHRPELRERLVVLERATYPRDKPCAGAVGGRADLALAELGVRVDVPSSEVTGFSVALPGGTVVRHEPRGRPVGRVVRRIEFDARLAQLVQERGVRVRTGVAVQRVDERADAVVLSTNQGALTAGCVVGADGVGSVVRRVITPAPARWKAQALEVETPPVPSDGPRSLLAFNAIDSAFRGYLWDFPSVVGGRPAVNRGIYRVTPSDASTGLDELTGRLEAHLAGRGLALNDCVKKRYAERGFAPRDVLSTRRLALVGEAAGVDPVTGEGIAQAILMGRWAGRALARRWLLSDLRWWKWGLLGDGVGLDAVVRHQAAKAFFGAQRGFHERALLNAPDFVAWGAAYFGGLKPSLRLAAKIGLRGLRHAVAEWRGE